MKSRDKKILVGTILVAMGIILIAIFKLSLIALVPSGQYSAPTDCKFITNVDPYSSPYTSYDNTGVWVAVDVNNDGVKEKFGRYSKSTSTWNSGTAVVTNFNSNGDDIYYYYGSSTGENIYVRRDSGGYVRLKKDYGSASSAITECVQCTPKTCFNLGKNCGIWNDGCGGSLSCGFCQSSQICTDGVCAGTCAPLTCLQLGKSCGLWNDSCGGSLDCGTCVSGKTCQNGACVSTCTPSTCTNLGKNCGSWSDGCGGTLSCGNCQSNQQCLSGICTSANTSVSATCGNNIIESGEVCDGSNINSKKCSDFSMAGSGVMCKSDCSGYDISSCTSGQVIPECTPNWKCTSWGSCINYQIERLCSDQNNCGEIIGKPIEYIDCISETILIESPTTQIPPECTVGERCIGTHYYLCQENIWVDKGEVQGRCNYISTCTEGESKCIGNTLYTCYNGEDRLDSICIDSCKEGKCIKTPKPLMQYILIVIILGFVAYIIYRATKSKRGEK